MKKNNRFIASIVIISAIAIGIHVNSFADTGKIKGDSVRLREEDDTSAEVIDTYGDGEKVEVIEKTGEWYKIKVDGQTGYVYQDYIVVDETTDNNTESDDDEKTKTDDEQEKKEDKKEDTTETTPDETKTEENKNEEAKKTIEVKLGKTKAASKQNIYILPNIGSSVIGEVKKDADINVIQELNGWAYVSMDSIQGWTRYDKIVTEAKVSNYEEKDDTKQEEKNNDKNDETKNTEKEEENKKDETKTEATNEAEKTGYISGTSVNLRAKASTNAEVIDTLNLNTEVTITAEDDEWYKVKVGSQVGYVSKEFVSDKKTETTSRSSTEERTTEKSSKGSSEITGQDIVDYAMQFKGYPYVYAAADPSVGFDCSGLAWYVYKHFGYSIERSSRGLASDGKTISKKSDLQPGDVIVFLAYNDYSRVGHVGIYIGNNQFIHANDESTGVIITSLDYGKYPERFVSGRRFID